MSTTPPPRTRDWQRKPTSTFGEQRTRPRDEPAVWPPPNRAVWREGEGETRVFARRRHAVGTGRAPSVRPEPAIEAEHGEAGDTIVALPRSARESARPRAGEDPAVDDRTAACMRALAESYAQDGDDTEAHAHTAAEDAPDAGDTTPYVREPEAAYAQEAEDASRQEALEALDAVSSLLREAEAGAIMLGGPAAPRRPTEGRARGDARAVQGAEPGPRAPEQVAPAPPQLPASLLSSYRLIGTIASGAMGTVFEAEHVHLQRRVAIKVMHREMCRHEELRRRFLGEAVAIARLSHPGAVKIFDYGAEPDGAAYLIMEYLPGMSLADDLLAGPLPLDRALDLGHQIAVALGAAHSAGIVHRDIKPDNVYVVREPHTGGEQVKLLDFGVAKFTDDTYAGSVKTHTGRIIGTPLYMSPEQCLSKPVDARTDVYGLGCLLYHMIWGAPPFTGQMTDILMAHCRKDPDIPDGGADAAETAVAALLGRMLAKKPRDRPQTMDEVASVLRAIRTDPHQPSAAPAFEDTALVVTGQGGGDWPSRLGRALCLVLIVLAAFVL